MGLDPSLIGKMLRDLLSLQYLVQKLAKEVESQKSRINQLEQINKDRIDDEKVKQFYEDKLGL